MTRSTLTALVSILVLAACSGGKPADHSNTPASKTTGAGNTVGQDRRTGVEAVPQDPDVHPAWLAVSCMQDSRMPTFKVDDQTLNRESFIKKLQGYGLRQDPDSGLPGQLDPGISNNPVVVQAQWTDNARVLFEVMECCGIAGIRRLVLDLGSRRFCCDLPTDSPPPPPPPSPNFPEDGDGLPDASSSLMAQTGGRSIRVVPVFSKEQGVYGFSVNEKQVKSPVKEGAFKIRTLVREDRSIDLNVWSTARDALVEGLEKLNLGAGRHEVSVVVCHSGSTIDKLDWASIAAVAVCIDAVNHMNARRSAQRKPSVLLTFRLLG
ncbi:MAG: hypothetical protein HS108_02950 [Planctomycetes bacterium]|nr:hypothetical protein [Planctomycetota bacterium]MCL4730118.1 hypothetical protein [Planctomycetota bacterium]